MSDTILRLRALAAMLRGTFYEWREWVWRCDLDHYYCCPGDPMRDECGCGGTTNRQIDQGLCPADRCAGQEDGMSEIDKCMARCPDYPDFPTAWAIQKERGHLLTHNPKCSSIPGWHPLSGPAFLCDCGAVEREWDRIKAERTGTERDSVFGRVIPPDGGPQAPEK